MSSARLSAAQANGKRAVDARAKQGNVRGTQTSRRASTSPAKPTLDEALTRLTMLEARYAASQRENIELLQLLARYADVDIDALSAAPPESLQRTPTAEPKEVPKKTTQEFDPAATARIKEAERAAALLRAQLEQVEDELQRELLNRIEASARAEKAKAALNLLAQHNDDAVAWRHAELTQGDARLRMNLEDAILGGREVPRISVDALRNDEGIASLVIVSDCLRQQRLLVSSQGGTWRTNGQALFIDRQESLVVRATLIALQRLVVQRRPAKANAWLKSFDSMRKGLDAKVDGWKARNVVLRAVQVNPGYEHLWFELEDATFGDTTWPIFQFRLGAASIRKGAFTSHPRLEFPLQSPAPHQFEKWFDECEDEHGPKLELRFDLRRAAVDLDVWNELSVADQRALAGLLADLPGWIADHYAGHPSARRPATEWINLAHDVADLLLARDLAAGGAAFA